MILSEQGFSDNAAVSAAVFTPDNHLVIALMTGHLLLLNPEGAAIQCWTQHRQGNFTRLLKPLPHTTNGTPGKAADPDAIEVDAEGISEEDGQSETQEDVEEEDVSVQMLTTSMDGAWLASVDLSCNVHIFNLDSTQVRD